MEIQTMHVVVKNVIVWSVVIFIRDFRVTGFQPCENDLSDKRSVHLPFDLGTFVCAILMGIGSRTV